MKADILFRSKSIFDGKTFLSGGGFIAVNGNRITGKGTLNDAENMIGPGTKVVDVGDKLLMPGFHDNHNHIYLSMIFSSSVFLGDTRSEQEAVKKLKEQAKSQEDSEWILGYGWHQAKWINQQEPTAASLDVAFPDKPVFLMHETGHAAWVNSLVLKRYGITKETKDPHNGIFRRDEYGVPTGFILEDAYIPIAKDAFRLGRNGETKAFRKYLKTTAQYGITSVDDMFYIMGLDLGNPELYREFEEQGDLPLRIHFFKKITKNPETLQEYQQYDTPRVRFQGCKMFMDGVASTYTAYMVEPYYNRSDFHGEAFHTEEDVYEYMKAMDSANYKMRIHAVGDGSVRRVLNAYEKLVDNYGKKDRRHCIEHIEIIHPDDIDRFGKLGLIPALQPNHMAITEHLDDNPFLTFLGREREPYYWIGKTLIDKSGVVTYGTDFPISNQDPMLTVFRAVNRVMDDMKPHGGWNPQEKVDLKQVLCNYTYNGAYSNFREGELGSLSVGNYADIICLSENIIDMDSLNLKDVKTVLTMSGGKIVHDAI